MTCFNPKYALYTYRTIKSKKDNKFHLTKDLTFTSKANWENAIVDNKENGKLLIPCGKCIGCKISKASDWATRCVYESKQWKNNCFITLTYSDAHLKSKSLCKRDIQLFLKKLRKQEKGIESRIYKGEEEYPIRYFYSGEYGETTHRPHFHIGIFNWIPDDVKLFRIDEHNNPEYISKKMSKYWNKGFHLIKHMTYETATYIARYTLKKLFDKSSIYINKKLTPEFIETSRRGGIGYQLLENYEEFEKMKRNYGIFIHTLKGTKLKSIPNFYKIKWRNISDQDKYEYFYLSDKNRLQAEENAKKLLEQTSYNRTEYLQIKKRTLIEKLRNSKATKRNRIKQQLQLSI